MWSILKKTKNTEPKSNPGFNDKAARKIADSLLWVQRSWAKWMFKQSERFSQKTKKIMLACFVLLAFWGLGKIAVKGLSPRDEGYLPNHSTLKIPAVTSREYDYAKLDSSIKKNIRQLRNYLDSLETTSSGRIEKGRLLKLRPGLLDSLSGIEEFYQLRKSR
jgi:hypothetical protein